MTKSYSNLRSLLFVCAVFLLSNFYSFSAFGQCNPAANDPSFNPDDVGFGNIRGTNDIANSAVKQLDGKVIIGGKFTKYNLNNVNKLVRIFPNGDIDTSFDTDGVGFGVDAYINDMALQSDGKVIAVGVGNFGNISGVPVVSIIRLNPDGSRDTSFDTGTGFFEATSNFISVEYVKIQSDGKILLSGIFNFYNGTPVSNFIRLNSDGTLDTSFVPPNTISFVDAIEVLDNDQILVTTSPFVGGQFSFKLLRLNQNGDQDNTFVAAEFDSFTSVITKAPNGKILVGGRFTSYDGYASRGIVRLEGDGTVDNSFISGVLPTSSTPSPNVDNIIINQDNDITIAGSFDNYMGASLLHSRQYARLNPDGTLDYLHDSNFISFEGGNARSMIELEQGRMLVVGDLGTTFDRSFLGIADFDNVMIINRNGKDDKSFNILTGIDTEPEDVIVVGNQIYIAGNINYYNGKSVRGIAKLNLNGELDTTYTPIPMIDPISQIALSPSRNRLLIKIGGFYYGNPTSQIMKINLDGTIDNSFSNTLNSPQEFTFQNDGKILISGEYSTGLDPNYLYRLNENGSRDYSFVSGSGFNNLVTVIKQQNDGKILVGGYFSSYKNIPVRNLVRLLPNGDLDTSFDIGTGFNEFIGDVVVQNDGKIIVAGRFTTFNSQPKGKIIRLNSDGSLDNTFNIGTGFHLGTIINVVLQSNGKILFNAPSNSLNGNPVSSGSLMRLNVDGSIDYSFVTDTGVNNIVEQEDGKLILVGDFSSINGVGRNGIARIVGDNIFEPTNNTDFDDQFDVCPNTTTTLEVFNSGTAYWYDSPMSTTSIHTGSSFTTPILTADSTYFYVQDSVAGCGSSSRLEMLVVTSQRLRANAQDYTAYLDSMGNVEISAIQLDSLSRPACNDSIVSYTFRDTGLETRSYSCADSNVVHEIWLQITDNNGNIDTAQAFIQVKDTIAPAVQTQPFAISLATSTSVVTINARDFIYSLSDNCTDSSNIEVVFNDTGLATKDFSCGSFTNTNSDIRITDLAGNSIILNTIITSDDIDFDIHLSCSPLRPTLPSFIQILATNSECVPVSGQVTVTLDNLTTYTNLYSNYPHTVVGNIVTFDFDNLAESLPSFYPYFSVLVDSSANIGDSICFEVKIAPTNGDIASTVIKNYCFPVVNSYDPNDKQVYPQGICDDKFTQRSDLPLTYTIRFQNTGNAPALNVNIVDSLSSLLDRSSLRVVGSSHPMVVDTTANNNVINFVFNDINLPDSTSSPALSQGYVIFELDEIAAHTDTSRIENKSYIYFDTNAPIITNTVKNTILDVLPLCDPAGGSNPPIADCQLPTNLTAEALSATKAKLSWTTPANSNAINYEIWRNNQLLETVVASQLSFVDSLLNPSTQYTYSIKAICGNNTATSNFVQVRTIPSTPTLFSLEAACKGETGTIEVRSNGAVYRVYASQNAASPLFETNNATIQTPALNDTTTFYISVVVNSLESERLEVVVPIKEVFEAIVEQGSLFETCTNTFTLSANEVENASYLWFRGNIQVGNTRALVVSFEGNYTVRIEREGCFAVSEATKVVFVDAPTAKIEQGSEVSFCGNGMLNAQDTSSNVTYTWSLNGTDVGTGTSISVSESGNYTLTASQPSCLDSVSIAVTITDLPAMVLAADKTEICSSEETTLSVTTGTGFTYKWFRNQTAISNDSSTLVTSEIGTYKVEITTTEGCQVESNEVEITEAQAPDATITINKENSVDKTITVSSSDSIVAVVWFKDGNEIASFNNQKMIQPTESGNYKAKVTYLSGCEFETEEKVFTFDIETGIEEESAKIFTVYPNPNTGSFKVEFATTTNQKTNLVVVDALGRTIYSKEISRNEKTTNIALPKISAGVYVVQIVSQGKVYTEQLVIQ